MSPDTKSHSKAGNTLPVTESFWTFLNKVVLVILIPWMTWMTLIIIANQREIAVMQGNRFTAMDAVQMRRDIEMNIPPAWHMREFEQLEGQVVDHEGRIDVIERGRDR